MNIVRGKVLERKDIERSEDLCPACQKPCEQVRVSVLMIDGKVPLPDELRCSKCGFQRIADFKYSEVPDERLAQVIYGCCRMAESHGGFSWHAIYMVPLLVLWPLGFAYLGELLKIPDEHFWVLILLLPFYLYGLFKGFMWLGRRGDVEAATEFVLPIVKAMRAGYPDFAQLLNKARPIAIKLGRESTIPWPVELDRWLEGAE